MALTPSKMLRLGTPMPEFRLLDTEGAMVTDDYFDCPKAYVVIFMCNHCPYVVHIRSVLAKVTADLLKKGVAVFGINSNDVKNYPEDSPEKMKEEKKKAKYLFPYLFDESQKVAKAYEAACTPDFYVFDANKRLVYRGQFDESRPGNHVPVTGKDLVAAVEAVLSGRSVNSDQRPSMGCNIKWK